MRTAALTMALLFALGGCSAIVSPDRSALGSAGDAGAEADGSTPAGDASAASDASAFDSGAAADAAPLADATVHTDAGGLDATPPMDAALDAPSPVDATLDAPGPIPGDTCAAPIAVTFARGATTREFSGDFTGTAANYATTCLTEDPGPDLVFAVDVPAGQDLTVDTEGSGADTVIAVSKTCPSLGSSFALACNDDVGNVVTGPFWSRVWLHNVSAAFGAETTRVFVLVKTFGLYATSSYSVRFSVRATPADTCSAPPLDITGGGTVYGEMGPYITRAGSCGGSFAAEATFRFGVRSDDEPAFRAQSSDFAPVVYVRSSCNLSEDDEHGCETATTVSSSLRETWLSFGPDDLDRAVHRVFVDGAMVGDTYTLEYIP